jgi:hypothetical protein
VKARKCTNCGSEWHYKYQCPLLPKKRIITRVLPKKLGRAGKETNSAVAKWKRTQKPDHQGYYTCYISGAKITYLMAEHPYSKVKHPELRATQKFEPVSAEINKLKGSMDIDEFLEKYPIYKATVKPEYLKETT